MTAAAPAVHLLCGFNGAGKTTLARELEASLPAVRFSLDDWMLRLYPGLHYESGAYGDRAENCKLLIWDTARQVLQAGTDVVLDWNQWAGAPGHRRRAESAADSGREPGSHALTEVSVRHLAGIFEEPAESEGLPIIRVSSG